MKQIIALNDLLSNQHESVQISDLISDQTSSLDKISQIIKSRNMTVCSSLDLANCCSVLAEKTYY